MDYITEMLCGDRGDRGMVAPNLSQLRGETLEIAKLCIGTRGDGKGRLRRSKPVMHAAAGTPQGILEGKASYVWRMLVFLTSREGRHQCMPVTADWDLSYTMYPRGVKTDHDAVRAEVKRLDAVVDEILETVPKTQWSGVRRWGRALTGVDPVTG